MEQFQQILNSTDKYIIYSLDKEYNYTVFNKNHADTMKHDIGAEIEIGKPFLEYIKNKDDRKRIRHYFDRAIGGEEFSEKERFGNPHTQKLYENLYAPLKNDEQKIIGLTVFSFDLSKQLKDTEILKSINERISDGVYRSYDKHLTYVNTAFLELFGYDSIEEIRALNLDVIYKNPEQRIVLRKKIKEEGFFVNQEMEFVKKTGEVFYSLISAISHTDPDGCVYIDGVIKDITKEHKVIQKERADSKIVQSINHNVDEAIYRSEKTKGLIFGNDAFVRMFGYESIEEVIQNNSLNLYKNPETRNRLRDLLKEDSISNVEVEFKRKNGTCFWGSVSAIKIKEDHGGIYYDGIIRDISKRKITEFELIKSQKLLTSINENIVEGIYRSNGEKLIYVNKAFLTLFGYPSEAEVFKQKFSALQRIDPSRKTLTKILKNDSFENEEIIFIKKNGEEFTGLISSSSGTDGSGDTFWDGAIRDISVQKKAEKQILLQTKMQQILTKISTRYINLPLDEVDDAIIDSLEELGVFSGADRAYVFDVQGDMTINTHEWSREGITFGLTPPPTNTSPFPFRIKGRALIIDDVALHDQIEYRDWLLAMDIKSLVALPCLENAQCVGFVGFDYVLKKQKISNNEIVLLSLFAEILVNIKIRTRQQKERQKLLEKTTSQNNRLKDFSYITSHNIRSSVSNFLGLLNIQREDPTNKDIGDMLENTAQKLNNTIKNINELLNFEQDIGNLNLIKCNLKKTIQHAIDLNKQVLREKRIDVCLEASDKAIVRGIPAYLDSIFHNFLTNAIKYGIKKGSKKINIKVISQEDNGYLVSFTDFGLGIDMEKYGNKIFQLGKRFHSGVKDGQGLGLFMVKRHIDAMGGRIEVVSKLNKGTTFNVWLYG